MNMKMGGIYFIDAWYVQADLGIEHRKSCNLITALIWDRNAAKFAEHQ